MNGHAGLAAQNHASRTTDQEPLWVGVLVWVVLLLVIAATTAL